MNHRTAKYFSRSKIFYFSLIAFILGISCASWAPSMKFDIFYIFLAACALFAAGVLVWPKRILACGYIVPAFFILGFWRYGFSLPENSADFIGRFYEKKVRLEAVIAREPEIKGGSQSLVLEPETIDGIAAGWRGYILAKTTRAPVFKKNDLVAAECKLKEPRAINSFEYGRYLAAKNIYALCYPKSVKIIRSASDSSFYAYLNAFRKRMESAIMSGMNEPEAGLAAALTLGGQAGVDKSVQEDFTRTGLAHVISISGSHMSILAGLAMYIFIMIGLYRRPASVAAAAFIIAYTFMIGAPAAAVRSAIMGIVVLVALAAGRLNNSIRAVALAAALMLAFNPKLLRDDSGFQLSFLATAGLALFFAPLDEKLSKIRITKNFPQLARSSFALTFSAIALTLPITVWQFKNLPLVSPFSNFAVAWILPFELSAILAGALIGAVFPSLAFFALIPAWFSTAVVIKSAHILASFKYSAIEFSDSSAKIASISYAALFGLVCSAIYLRAKQGKKERPAGAIEAEILIEEKEYDLDEIEKKLGTGL
jgi:competence protein ComEC